MHSKENHLTCIQIRLSNSLLSILFTEIVKPGLRKFYLLEFVRVVHSIGFFQYSMFANTPIQLDFLNLLEPAFLVCGSVAMGDATSYTPTGSHHQCGQSDSTAT